MRLVLYVLLHIFLFIYIFKKIKNYYLNIRNFLKYPKKNLIARSQPFVSDLQRRHCPRDTPRLRYSPQTRTNGRWRIHKIPSFWVGPTHTYDSPHAYHYTVHVALASLWPHVPTHTRSLIFRSSVFTLLSAPYTQKLHSLTLSLSAESRSIALGFQSRKP